MLPSSRRSFFVTTLSTLSTLSTTAAAAGALTGGRTSLARAQMPSAAAPAPAALASFDVFDAAVAPTTQALQALLKAEPALIHSRDREGWTPLQRAAAAGRADAVELLAFRGSALDPPPLGPLTPSPLYLAAGHADRDAVERMVWAIGANGADPNAAQPDGRSALHAAAAAGHLAVVDLLLRRGAHPDARDREGATPHHAAVRAGHQAVARLLAEPARVRRNVYTSRYARDAKGASYVRNEALGVPQAWINQFVSLAHGNLEQVKVLCARCPDLVFGRAVVDEMAVEASAHVGLEDGVRFLLDKGAPASICTAAMLGQTTEVARMLAEDPSRVHERGPHDLPLFFYPMFVKAGRLDVAQQLAAAGADPQVDLRGLTALHLAVRQRQTAIVEWLLSRGLDPNAESRHPIARGRPLAIAAKQEGAAIADLLRRHGAHP